MKGAPFCVVDSMTIQICGDGKLWIKDAIINATMIKQIVEYVLETKWPTGMTKWPTGMTRDKKLVAALMHYSMASDYQFTQANVKGCGGFAAWCVFDLTMIEHAFIVYTIEIHTLEAIFHCGLDRLRTTFAQFSREDDSVFAWTAPYAIISILALDCESGSRFIPTQCDDLCARSMEQSSSLPFYITVFNWLHCDVDQYNIYCLEMSEYKAAL